VLVLLLLIILYVFLKEIETVKLLGSDVCNLCMEKTGCSCFCIN